MCEHLSAQSVFCMQMSGLIIEAQKRLPDILNNRDIEALHDYRVGLRKARVLLSISNKMLPQRILLAMKEDLEGLFSATGRLRDFDLLLEKLHHMKQKQIPVPMELITDIKEQRQCEHEQFLSAFQNRELLQRFQNLYACLDKLVQQHDQISLDDYWPALIKQSTEDVHTAYKRLRKNRKDKQIHKLRISLKKLRYCIELLGVSVRPDRAKEVLAWLKVQQDSLGKYNDLKVQARLIKGNMKATKKVKNKVFRNDLERVKKKLPLAASDWRMLNKKLHALL